MLLLFTAVPELFIAGDNAKAVNVSLGTPDYSIQCTYRAFPRASIQWYKNGELLVESEQYKFEVTDGEVIYPYHTTTSTLKFYNGKNIG